MQLICHRLWRDPLVSSHRASFTEIILLPSKSHSPLLSELVPLTAPHPEKHSPRVSVFYKRLLHSLMPHLAKQKFSTDRWAD
jgi:hypothetical protein